MNSINNLFGLYYYSKSPQTQKIENSFAPHLHNLYNMFVPDRRPKTSPLSCIEMGHWMLPSVKGRGAYIVPWSKNVIISYTVFNYFFTFNIYCTHGVKISIRSTFCWLLINKIIFFPISSAYVAYIFNDVKLIGNLAIILCDWQGWVDSFQE